MIDKTIKKSTLTTIGIDQRTNKLIDKLCKRYSLKKGEIVKLAFMYMDRACINPAEAPESTKAELSKINKRQDDIIRFIRNYEEKELNPMIRVCHTIASRFELTVKALTDILTEKLSKLTEMYDTVLNTFSKKYDILIKNTDSQKNTINRFIDQQKTESHNLYKLIILYNELELCGITDGKKKEKLKEEIKMITDKLVN